MLRSILAFSALALAASPAVASNYSARTAEPAGSERIIVRDMTWICDADACVGTTDKSRPLVLCQGLAKKAGRIESFRIDGRAIDAGELDRCNQSAKDAQARSLAAQ